MSRSNLIKATISVLIFAAGALVGSQMAGNHDCKMERINLDRDTSFQLYQGIEENGNIMYKELYAITIWMDYAAYHSLEKGDIGQAKKYIGDIIQLKVDFPKLWPLHGKEITPESVEGKTLEMEMEFIKEIDDPNFRKVLHDFYRVGYFMDLGKYEEAYLILVDCAEFQRENGLEIPSNEQGISSCADSEEAIIERMLKSDCCGFLNMMHSKNIPYEKKKDLLNRLSQMIKEENGEQKENK